MKKIEALKIMKLHIASYIHKIESRLWDDIFSNSRLNDGGSLTVPKKFVDKMKNDYSAGFYDLETDKKNVHKTNAQHILDSIKIVIDMFDPKEG